MDPITIGIVSGVALGAVTILNTLRARRSPKNKIKHSQKRAIRDARMASKAYKKKVKKTVSKHR